MLHLHYDAITQWLQIHPHWGGITAFLIAFTESIAVIGSIVPGSVTMTAIGILAGSGVIPFWFTIFLAILGAICGDGLSYFFGFHYKEHITDIWPFKKHPKLLTIGEAFFNKHGGKSVLIGRFVGPVRAVIPVIAGMLKMSPKRYFPISMIAAIFWAPCYMLPGILLGAVSLEMPADVATGLIVSILVMLVAFWAFIWICHKLYLKTHLYFEHKMNALWDKWNKQPSKRWLCVLLRRADHPHEHGQFLLALFCLFCISCFLILFANVIFHGPLLHFNDAVYHLFRGLRTQSLDKIMIIITALGYKYNLLALLPVFLVYFIIRKHYSTALYFLSAVLASAGSVVIFKHFVYSQRPQGILHATASSSFPSGHTTFAIVIYGFLAYLIARKMPFERRKVVYGLTALLCLLIGISRLYLNAHWLTDVIGALFLGLSILSFIVILHRRNLHKPFSTRIIFLLTLITLTLSVSLDLRRSFNAQLYNNTPYWPTHTINDNEWWHEQSELVPFFRKNRLGHPAEILNIEWAGSLANIKTTLSLHGWTDLGLRDYVSTLKKLTRQISMQHIPFFDRLHNDQPPVLEMMKKKDIGPTIVLRLWNANIKLTPSQEPLWVGSIYYVVHQKHFIDFFHKAPRALFDQVNKDLLSALTNYIWESKQITPDNLPENLLNKQNMLYRIILIKPRFA